MKAVIQRVAHAGVTIEGALKASVGKGLLVLLGVGYEDLSLIHILTLPTILLV